MHALSLIHLCVPRTQICVQELSVELRVLELCIGGSGTTREICMEKLGNKMRGWIQLQWSPGQAAIDPELPVPVHLGGGIVGFMSPSSALGIFIPRFAGFWEPHYLECPLSY